MKSSIVVTGVGVVSPLGCGAELVWTRLIEGRSGLRRLPDQMVEDIACKIAGVVPSIGEDLEGGFDPDRYISPKEQRRMDRFIQFAVAATDEALKAAKWPHSDLEARERTATIIASGVGGFPVMMEASRITEQRGPRKLSPFTVPSFLANLAAGQISIRHGLRGPLGSPVTACAASVQAIGDGARLISSGEADVVVAGGAEACIDRVSLAAFGAARALSSGFNDTPKLASRPYDTARDGFVMGEGAATLVLERADHARARGVPILAELLGYGTSADAYHITAGPEDGEGAARAMHLALRQADLAAAEIEHVNAHATSTPLGDAGELMALAAIFGRSGGPAISATKSATGHLLGAAGALEAVFSILALRDQLAPPTLNLEAPDPKAHGLDLVHTRARGMPMRHVISNGFGFGGVNASVIFGRR